MLETAKQPPQIVIISGPNGAGKSTTAKALLRDILEMTTYVNADTIAAGLSAFHPENVALEAGRITLKWLHHLAEKQADFAFETTLSSRSYAQWVQQQKQKGYHCQLVFLWLNSPNLAVQRVKERVASGGHNIPETTIHRRYKKGIQNFFDLYKKIADNWTVYDNSIYANPVLMAKGKLEKVLELPQPELWKQFCEAKL